MAQGNKNLSLNCRYLNESDFAAAHSTFLEAFSDYFVPAKITEEQFNHHIALNSVELNRSVGAFNETKMVGFTLNGFGKWNGRPTIYDAGTGVIPDFRKRGIGKMIFEFMMPHFRDEGFEQILLEVITENKPAIGLYEKLGFQKTRRLLIVERQADSRAENRTPFEIREITEPDWHLFETFADGQTSWQNSMTAMKKTPRKTVFGAFFKDECIGYGIFFPKTGMITQIAVAPSHRGCGAASAILSEMQKRIGKEKNLRAGNIDENITSAVVFFEKLGFIETLSQLEMIKVL